MQKVRKIGIDGKEHTYTVLSEEEIAAKKAEMQKHQEERMPKEEKITR